MLNLLLLGRDISLVQVVCIVYMVERIHQLALPIVRMLPWYIVEDQLLVLLHPRPVPILVKGAAGFAQTRVLLLEHVEFQNFCGSLC